ncbi:MAG: hypothetical protein PHV74_16010 [Dehalococcoidia bacterium]|nr:hypothetical protein [Dehalococcoidia bacterium]
MENMARELIHYVTDNVYLADDPQLNHYMTGSYTAAITQQVLEFRREVYIGWDISGTIQHT